MATITATSGGARGTATITVVNVTGRVASVIVAPPEATITALGDTVRLAAVGFDENGHAVAGAVFSWTSGDRTVASVDERGLVTAVAEGTATITANVEASVGICGDHRQGDRRHGHGSGHSGDAVQSDGRAELEERPKLVDRRTARDLAWRGDGYPRPGDKTVALQQRAHWHDRCRS